MREHDPSSAAATIRAQAFRLQDERAALARRTAELEAFEAECEDRLAADAHEVTTPYDQRISRAYRDALAATDENLRERHLDTLEWLVQQQRLTRELTVVWLDASPERERAAAQLRALGVLRASLAREVERVNLELAALAKALVEVERTATTPRHAGMPR